jgi:hypothetical protein
MTLIRSVLLPMLAGGSLFLAYGADMPSPSGGSQLHSKINVQQGMEHFVTAAPNILDTTTTDYAFGRTVSRRTMAVQVHIANSDASHELLIHEISLEVCKTNDDRVPAGQHVKGALSARAPEGQHQLSANPEPASATDPFPCHSGSIIQMSSLDKYVLQGVADRGQSRDPRNMVLRLVTGVGAAATPLPTIIHHLGGSFLPGVAAWNGPFVEAYKGLFPDYTVNQVVRLSNAAFDTNKIVPKTSSVKVTIFVPIEMLLDKEQIHQFHKDPYTFFTFAAENYRVLIDCQFITPVAAPGASGN